MAKLALLESLGKISQEFYQTSHSSTIPQFYVDFESPFIKKPRLIKDPRKALSKDEVEKEKQALENISS